MTTATAAGSVDLADPDTFVAGVPHEAFAELRRTDPVHWQPMDGQSGFWAVLRHADVVHVARHPEIFSSSAAGVVVEDLPADALARMRNMLLAMDPPRHHIHRAPLSPHFRPRIVAGMELRVREICRDILAGARERREVEFVHDVASRLPTQVIGELFGLPRQDWSYLQKLAEITTSSQDPDLNGPDHTEGQAGAEMASYAVDFARARRRSGRVDDLTGEILDADFGGRPMSDVEFGGFFVQLVTAGNDTTKGMLSSGLLTLLRHPDQLADLRADRALLAPAVEEIIRYDNPLHYFRRTATEDTELAGTAIAAGDKVAMYYTSANRDEAVFDDPFDFRVDRDPNRHLAFGSGEHFCLGAHLARRSQQALLAELVRRLDSIELAGEPERIHSTFVVGLKRLPLRYRVSEAE